MKNLTAVLLPLVLLGGMLPARNKDKNRPKSPSPLERYIDEARQHQAAAVGESPGSIFSSPTARLTNLPGDLRAARLDDIVTILVVENTSASAKGTVQTQRQSSAQSSITALGGLKNATGLWPNLANLGTQTQLNGQGVTTRSANLTTTVTARVTQVLPNGNLVIEGIKNVAVNSENQLITVRGVIRPVDIDTNNTVVSDRIGQMEVLVNGKGVVNDSVRRPFFLYRLLLGLLPF